MNKRQQRESFNQENGGESIFNSQFNFSPYRFIDRYILIDSFKIDS